MSLVTFFKPEVISEPLLRAERSPDISGPFLEAGPGADSGKERDPGGGGGGAAGPEAAGAAEAEASPPLGFQEVPVV